jgi:hypothetical protein
VLKAFHQIVCEWFTGSGVCNARTIAAYYAAKHHLLRRHCERSEAIQSFFVATAGLPRRFAKGKAERFP